MVCLLFQRRVTSIVVAHDWHALVHLPTTYGENTQSKRVLNGKTQIAPWIDLSSRVVFRWVVSLVDVSRRATPRSTIQCLGHLTTGSVRYDLLPSSRFPGWGRRLIG